MLILASHSPRRREILAQAGIPFVVQPADAREEQVPGEDAASHVRRLARLKAEAVRGGPGDLVLGADTVVAVDDEILGKPVNAAQATEMLRRLSGREHRVVTGICLIAPSVTVVDAQTTQVRFVPLSEQEIAGYVASGEPMDKAGAYAIQGLASKFIDRLEGCYFNVVGLPVALVYKHWKALTAAAGTPVGAAESGPWPGETILTPGS